jgi:hypothetical protein
MRPILLELLEQDIFTDAEEFFGRVEQVKEIVRDIRARLAEEPLIERARDFYGTDDVEVDGHGVETSRAADGKGDGENGQSIGTWVQAWVWVPDRGFE